MLEERERPRECGGRDDRAEWAWRGMGGRRTTTTDLLPLVVHRVDVERVGAAREAIVRRRRGEGFPRRRERGERRGGEGAGGRASEGERPALRQGAQAACCCIHPVKRLLREREEARETNRCGREPRPRRGQRRKPTCSCSSPRVYPVTLAHSTLDSVLHTSRSTPSAAAPPCTKPPSSSTAPSLSAGRRRDAAPSACSAERGRSPRSARTSGCQLLVVC